MPATPDHSKPAASQIAVSASGLDRATLTVSPFAYPLDEFYAQAGRRLPTIEMIDGALVPSPYKSLLVHRDDMTPTLERYFGKRIHLSVLRSQQRDGFYFREVILLLDETEKPVEFGAIKINLALFPGPARREILEEQVPLGRILESFEIEHTSRPKAFLKLQADPFIRGALKLSGEPTLYGRRNTLLDPAQRWLAEIVEILPPCNSDASERS
jgi:chorismate-pyruvate lyase